MGAFDSYARQQTDKIKRLTLPMTMRQSTGPGERSSRNTSGEC